MKFLKKVIDILTKPSKREMNLSRAKEIIIEDRRKLNNCNDYYKN